MSRTRPDLDYRLPGCVGDHPVEQPGVERRILELVDEVIGELSRDGVVRRPDAGVSLLRTPGDHGVSVGVPAAGAG